MQTDSKYSFFQTSFTFAEMSLNGDKFEIRAASFTQYSVVEYSVIYLVCFKGSSWGEGREGKKNINTHKMV